MRVAATPSPPAPPASAAPARAGAPCRFSALLGEPAPAPAPPPPRPPPTGPLSPPPPTPPAARAAEAPLARLFDGDRRTDRAIARVLGGGATTPGQLLALQVDVMRHAQTLELASRLVDKLTGAIKQTLTTQV